MEDFPNQFKRRRTATFDACRGISTHALEYGVIVQLIDACAGAQRFLRENPPPPFKYTREYELLVSRLNLVLAKVADREPGESV